MEKRLICFHCIQNVSITNGCYERGAFSSRLSLHIYQDLLRLITLIRRQKCAPNDAAGPPEDPAMDRS